MKPSDSAPADGKHQSDSTTTESDQQSNSVTQRLFADASEFAATAADSFVYSAIQSPLTGAAQLVDAVSGSHITGHVQLFKAPAPAKFGSLAWHAEQVGSGLGIAADFLVANKAVGASADRLLTGTSLEGLTAKAAIGRSALAGAVYQGVFTPSQGTGKDFWLGRLENAGSGAVTFGTLTGASIGLRSVAGTAALDSGMVSKVLKSDLTIGALAGVPAGIASAESSSLLHGKGLASSTEALQSAYSFVVAGGPLGLLHGLGVPAEGQRDDSSPNPASDRTTIETRQSGSASDSRFAPPEAKLAASDLTNTQWDSLKLQWKVFDQLDIKPQRFDLTQDARNQITSERQEVLKLTRNSQTADEHIDMTVPCTVLTLGARRTEIVIPDGNWDYLDAVRQWRELASTFSLDQKIDFDRLMARSAKAQGRKPSDPTVRGYAQAVLPEQLGYFLDELPDQNIVRRVVLWPDSSLKAAADANKEDINIYRFGQLDANDLRHLLFHEWSHVADNTTSSGAFSYAADLEDKGYYSRPYAKKNTQENLAVHLGEELLNPDADNFFIFADQAPLRSVALGEILRQRLGKAQESGFVSPYDQKFQDRVDYIDSHIVPQAKTALSEHLARDYDSKIKSLMFLDALAETNPELARRLVDLNQLRSMSGKGASGETDQSYEPGQQQQTNLLDQSVQPEQPVANGDFRDLIDGAKHFTWLNQKLEDANQGTYKQKVWAYDSLKHAMHRPEAVEALPRLVSSKLQAGGEEAKAPLEFLWQNPDIAPNLVEPQTLMNLAMHDSDTETAAGAMTILLTPTYFSAHGIENPLTPELLSRAKNLIELAPSESNAGGAPVHSDGPDGYNRNRMLNALFDKDQPWTAHPPPQLLDVMRTALNEAAHGHSQITDAALQLADTVNDTSIRKQALAVIEQRTESGVLRFSDYSYALASFMKGLTPEEQLDVALAGLKSFTPAQREWLTRDIGSRGDSAEQVQALNRAQALLSRSDLSSYPTAPLA